MAFSLLSTRYNDAEKYAVIEPNSEEKDRQVSVRRRTEPSVKIVQGMKYVPSYATDIRKTMRKFR